MEHPGLNPEYFGKHDETCTNNHYTKLAYIAMVRHALYPPPAHHFSFQGKWDGGRAATAPCVKPTGNNMNVVFLPFKIST